MVKQPAQFRALGSFIAASAVFSAVFVAVFVALTLSAFAPVALPGPHHRLSGSSRQDRPAARKSWIWHVRSWTCWVRVPPAHGPERCALGLRLPSYGPPLFVPGLGQAGEA
jgi:hypothetical protein